MGAGVEGGVHRWRVRSVLGKVGGTGSGGADMTAATVLRE